MAKTAALLFAVLCMAAPAEAGTGVKKIERPALNGAQVFVMDGAYKNDIGAFFRQAKAKGVDTVFFRVFHNAGDRPHFGIAPACPSGVYFKTDVLCTVNDALGPVAEAARRSGVKIYAWMATRSLTQLKSEDNMSEAFSPDGSVTLGYGANVFRPEVRSALIRLFKDLAAYDIDGILFQDDFIIKYTEGADAEAKALFLAETGIKAAPETFFRGVKEYNGKKTFTGLKDEFYIWAGWKALHMAKFFSALKEAARSVNPELAFAANIYYETPVYPEQGLAWYSQSIQALMAAGADYLAVMGYHEQIEAELGGGPEKTAAFIGDIAKAAAAAAEGEPARVIMKLQTASFLKGGRALPESEFGRVCSEVRKTEGVSIAVVPVFSSENIYGSCFGK